MTISSHAARVLTRLDLARLSNLNLRTASPELDACFDDADVVPSSDIPGDVITMNSRFVITDDASGESRTLMLCYPQDADPARGCISVLSPAGASLLGLRSGATACWQTPQGHRQTATVAQVLFQPEASGDLTR